MKKLLSLVLVLTFVFAGTAIAAEKFGLSGQYRAEFYSNDNANDWDDTTEDAEAYVDQRFRLQFELMPADNVKAVLRGDFAEQGWGNAYQAAGGAGYRPGVGNDTIMIDRAYVDLTTAMINWQVGLFGQMIGKGTAYDTQGAGVMVTGNFAPVTVTALWSKRDEGLGANPYQDDATPLTAANADEDIYALQVAYKTDAFGVGGYYAVDEDKNTGVQDDTATVFGVYGEASMGMISFWAAYDMYGGENENTSVDYFGNALHVNVVAALSDQLKLTGHVVWATGDEDATTKMQIQNGVRNDDGVVAPYDMGWNAGVGEDFADQGEGGLFENNTGAKTIGLKADFAINEAFSVYGGGAWSTPDVEDPNDDNMYVDNITVFALGGSYTFLPGTSFVLGYESASRSSGGTVPIADDSISKVMGALFVNF